MPRKKKYSGIDARRPKYYERDRRRKGLQSRLNVSTEKRVLEDHMYNINDSSTETETPDFNPLDNPGVDYVYPVSLHYAQGYLINHDHSYVDSITNMSDQIKMEIIPQECDESLATSNESVPMSNESVATSNESVATSNESVAMSNESVPTGNESVATSNELVAMSNNESVATSNESVATSNELVPTSNESVPTGNILYNNNDHVEIKNEPLSVFDIIAEGIKGKILTPYVCISVEDDIEIVEFYKVDGKISVKLSVNIDKTFHARVLVHRKELPSSHSLWKDLPAQFDSCGKILGLLAMLQEYAVCIGNPDEEFQILLPIGSGFEGSSAGEVYAYREGDFNAQLGDLSYKSTIRSVDCFLLAGGRRCPKCSSYRRSLWDRKYRLEEKAKHIQKNLVNSNYKHKDMTKDMLIEKIRQQKACLNTLQQDVDRQRRTIKYQREELAKMGVLQHDDDHIQFTQQIEQSPAPEPQNIKIK